MKTHALLATWLILAIAAFAAEPLSKIAPSSKPPTEIPVYELPKTGKNIPRDGGCWLNVEASGNRIVVEFFDIEKKSVPPDVDRGFVNFRYSTQNAAHAALNREGNALVTLATVQPPHDFLVILSLFSIGCADPVESYRFKYP